MKSSVNSTSLGLENTTVNFLFGCTLIDEPLEKNLINVHCVRCFQGLANARNPSFGSSFVFDSVLDDSLNRLTINLEISCEDLNRHFLAVSLADGKFPFDASAWVKRQQERDP